MPMMNFCFANDRSANPVAGISMSRRIILLLLGEKAGMREDVNPLIHIRRKSEPTHKYQN